MVQTYNKGKAVKLAANFKSTEFDCHGKNCCSKTKVDDAMVVFLQKIREHFGSAVTITSGYRCAARNKAVGGANRSKHKEGCAADFIVSGVAPKKVAQYAEKIGILGIGLYDDFVHIDTRSKKAFWLGHSETPCATFNEVTVDTWRASACADGFKLNAKGSWDKQCEEIAAQAICKKRLVYRYTNLTKLVQQIVGASPDGKFGNNTKTLVMKFQKAHGLTADGIVGINTWKTMLEVK